MTHPAEDIQLLEWDELVRRRPEMFIGQGRAALNWLAFALLDCPLEPRNGIVAVHDGVLDIWLESQPVSVAVRKSGSAIYLIEVCSTLTLPLDEPPSLNGAERLDGRTEPAEFRRTTQAPPAMALANAVSRQFIVKTVAAGKLVQATFSAGKLIDGPQEAWSASRDAVGYRFDPDPTLFPGAGFTFDSLARTAREFSAIRGVPLTLRNTRTGQTMIFTASRPPRAGSDSAPPALTT